MGSQPRGFGMVIGLVYYKLTEKNLGEAGLRSNHISNEEEKNRERKLWIGLWCVLLTVHHFRRITLDAALFTLILYPLREARELFSSTCVLIYFIYVFAAEKLDPSEKKKIFSICAMFVIATTFYAGFEGQGSSLNLICRAIHRYVYRRL